MNSSNSSRDKNLRLAQLLIESLRHDEEGQALLERLKSSPPSDASIDYELRNRLQAVFSTEVSGGQVEKIVNIAKANVVKFITYPVPEAKQKEVELQNIPSSEFKFPGGELEIEMLHQKLNQNDRVAVYSEEDIPIQTELVRQYAEQAWQKKIYPGGICWLKAHETDVERQIIDFAESKIGLQLPEHEKLGTQSQIDLCWSNWPKDQVLIVLDNVINYQEIKSCLPPNEKRFKLVITISQNFLEQSLLDDDFDTLCLCAPKKVSIEPINIYQSKFLYIFSVIILILLVLIGRSLYLSYVKADSIAWISKYTEWWQIELARSFLFFVGEIVILFGLFRREWRELFGLEKTPKEYETYRNITIFFVIALCITVTIIIFYYHNVDAPKKLAEWWNKKRISQELEEIPLDSNQGIRLYKLPYEYYLTYTLIIYIVIYLPVIAVTIYSAIKDVISLNLARRKLGDREKDICNLKDRGLFSKENICISIERNFQQLSLFFENKIKRYSSLFVILSYGVSFEVLLGRYTLADAAIVWAIIAYLLWFLAFWIMYGWSYQYYEISFNKTKKLLSTIDDNKAVQFQEKYNVRNFIAQLSSNYSKFNQGRNILIGVFILAIIIEFLKILYEFINQ